MGRFNVVVKTYRKLLENYSIVIQSLQTGVLLVTGDLIAQRVIERRKHVNFQRTQNFFLVGAGFAGPALTVWYRSLSKFVGKGNNKTIALKKVAIDQLFFGPISLYCFIILINKLDGKDWKFIKQELRLKYPSVLFTSYTVWPFVQLVNFYMVPLRHQVLFVQTVAIFWNTYLSWKTQNGSNE